MTACEVLWFDPAQVGRAIWGPPGRRDHLIGHHDGWRHCTAPAQPWVDPGLVLRQVCAAHQRQVAALHAAGMGGRVRWARTRRLA